MDLVDEQDVACAQVRERADEIAGLLERGPRRRANVHAELARDELGQRRLAQSGRPEEERVVERLAAAERGVDVDAQAVLHLLLADELRQPLRAERELDDGPSSASSSGVVTSRGDIGSTSQGKALI